MKIFSHLRRCKPDDCALSHRNILYANGYVTHIRYVKYRKTRKQNYRKGKQCLNCKG